jgi:hypothetical protein
MEKDALTEVGHKGFVTDAQTMAAILFDVATRPECLKAIQREFAGIKGLFSEYQADFGEGLYGAECGGAGVRGADIVAMKVLHGQNSGTVSEFPAEDVAGFSRAGVA